MKGFWKKAIAVVVVAGVAYLGYKTYKIVNDMIRLKRSLPDYLKDLLDEKPKIDVNMRFNSLSIAVGLSAEAFENLEIDLDDHIQSYILEYFPCLAKLKITTQKYIKATNDDDHYDMRKDANNVEDYDTVEVDTD
jgi:hypothetical protein